MSEFPFLFYVYRKKMEENFLLKIYIEKYANALHNFFKSMTTRVLYYPAFI